MSGQKLLQEWYKLEYKPQLINEALEAKRPATLSGIFQAANKRNANKRIYGREILQREIDNYAKAIRERRATGELDHPETSTVSLRNTSHVVTEIGWDGDNVVGTLEVLPTTNGVELSKLLSAGITVGISSRGVGSTNKQMTNEGEVDMVQDDFQLICFDIVSEPSTPGAYLFKEGRDIDVDPRKTWSRADRIFRALNEITRR